MELRKEKPKLLYVVRKELGINHYRSNLHLFEKFFVIKKETKH